QQLKGTLGGAKVRKAQGKVCSYHADEGDAVNVVSFGDHLRAYQQVDLAAVQLIQHALKIMASADRVAIQTPDAGIGKGRMQPLFNLFRPSAKEINVFTAALGTNLGNSLLVSAIVAFHAVAGFMERHGDGAVLALQRLATGPAQNNGRITTTVKQDHRLL